MNQVQYTCGNCGKPARRKRGPEHKTKLKDKARSVGKKLPGLLIEAVKAVLSQYFPATPTSAGKGPPGRR